MDDVVSQVAKRINSGQILSDSVAVALCIQQSLQSGNAGCQLPRAGHEIDRDFRTVLFILAGTAVSLSVTWSMIESPSIGPIISRIMAMFALYDVTSLGLLWFTYGPLPMGDYKDVMETQPIL
jgi:hypothetical protein